MHWRFPKDFGRGAGEIIGLKPLEALWQKTRFGLESRSRMILTQT